MVPGSAANTPRDRYHTAAVKHAQDLEYQKSMRNTVLDLIIGIVDLPSHQTANPAKPLASDVALFKRGLCLFQPSDFDDVVLERNIYDKCGFGLCPHPNTKLPGNSTNRIIWGNGSDPTFKVVGKSELEKWCSKECEERALFVRVQLSIEPAWLREQAIEDIKLLDETLHGDTLADLNRDMGSLEVRDDEAMPRVAELGKLENDRYSGNCASEEDQKRMKALSLERGQLHQGSSVLSSTVKIVEKPNSSILAYPPELLQADAGSVEGYKPKESSFEMENGLERIVMSKAESSDRQNDDDDKIYI